MKKLLFCFLLVLPIIFSYAQTVSIPDPEFRNRLKNKCFQCFEGNLLNTTCAATVTGTLYIERYTDSSNTINSIEGIQYLTSISGLYSVGNNLGVLPPLPDNIENLTLIYSRITSISSFPSKANYIYLDNNQLTSLPTLPNPTGKLLTLVCRFNLLTSLPPFPTNMSAVYVNDNKLTSLPNLTPNINVLDCSNNYITYLPDIRNLNILDCSHNNLTQIFENPSLITSTTLSSVDCRFNKISSVPFIPRFLKGFYCSNNNLSTFPSNWQSLEALDCSFNNLTALPTNLPKLTTLICSNNQIVNLGILPSNLEELDFSNNQVSNVTSLPSNLSHLTCDSNLFQKLPDLPSNLVYLKTSINCLPFLPNGLIKLYSTASCIPNKPSGLTTSIPICNPTNNPNQCQYFPVISGKVFNDINANGIKDANEKYRPDVKVILKPGELFTFSDTSGYYEISLSSLGTVTISATNQSYFASTSNVITLNTLTQTANANIALQPLTNVKDFAVSINNIQFLRRGFSQSIFITMENQGTVAAPASLSLSIPNFFQLTTITGLPNNKQFNWYFPNVEPGEKINAILEGITASTAGMGDIAQFTAAVNPTDLTDNTLHNNTYNLQLMVRSSFDPNDKQAPPIITPQKVSNGEFLEYTIRFQNTGNDTAFTVVISDTLTGNLQWKTFELIGSSHNCKVSNKDNIIYFDHQKIYLPDSNTNEPKSHGFVKFRIKPQNTLVSGDVITNKAGIYFDYNSPIYTNEAKTLVTTSCTGSRNATITPTSISACPDSLIRFYASSNDIGPVTFTWSNGTNSPFLTTSIPGFYTVTVSGTCGTEVSNSVQLSSINTCSGTITTLTTNQETPTLQIFPNPTNGLITIQSDEVRDFKIIDGIGSIVKNGILKQGRNLITLELVQGIYYFSSKEIVKKLVVE